MDEPDEMGGSGPHAEDRGRGEFAVPAGEAPSAPLMPLSMPPFSTPPVSTPPVSTSSTSGPSAPGSNEGPPVPDAGAPTLEQVWAGPPAQQVPGTALPGAGGAPPSGGQPPYFPPYGYGWPPGGLPESSPEPGPRPRHRRAVAALAAVALVTGGLGAGLGVAFSGTGATASQGGVAPLPQSPGNSLSSTGAKLSVPAIASAVEPAVVDIRTTVASPVGQAESAAGTGMIVTSSGEVLTNNHVVEHATSIRIVIAKHSGSYGAKVIGVNPTKDVALLQIEGVSNLPYVTLGNSSSVAVGDPVVAIGNALGFGGTPSVVSGQVSAVGRTITASDAGLKSETLHNLIQTTAQIQPGDSGGPLLDASGKVIGMDTAAASGNTGSTIGFAIPINEARTIVRQMEHHQAVGGTILGASAFLGVYEATGGSTGGGGLGSPFGGLPGFGGTSPSTPSVSGVTLGGVVGSSPAQKAGLAAGDVITSIDGTATPTWSALAKAIQAKAPGDTIHVSYVDSNGNSHTASAVLTALPQ